MFLTSTHLQTGLWWSRLRGFLDSGGLSTLSSLTSFASFSGLLAIQTTKVKEGEREFDKAAVGYNFQDLCISGRGFSALFSSCELEAALFNALSAFANVLPMPPRPAGNRGSISPWLFGIWIGNGYWSQNGRWMWTGLRKKRIKSRWRMLRSRAHFCEIIWLINCGISTETSRSLALFSCVTPCILTAVGFYIRDLVLELKILFEDRKYWPVDS